MSAMSGTAVPAVSRDLALLAPKFRAGVEAALAECESEGIDAFVYEAFRSNELQQLYYERGRTVKPPNKPVTNARTNLFSWHGYGLAVDVVSRKDYWKPPEGEAWFAKVAEIFKRHDCKWGGDWTQKDTPHFQWHRCKPSPSDMARLIVRQDGLIGVWRAVGAD
jgi:peptidoglycan L-alanyl-D-glutamate endopeptidase CwlK